MSEQEYATEAIHRVISSDAQLVRTWRARAIAAYVMSRPRDSLSHADVARYALADKAKDAFERDAEQMLLHAKATGTVWADLMQYALNAVDWDDFADRLLREHVDWYVREADAEKVVPEKSVDK